MGHYGRVASKGDPKRFNLARRPKYLFSGLTKCAECGGGYVMYSTFSLSVESAANSTRLLRSLTPIQASRRLVGGTPPFNANGEDEPQDG